jgi:type I restriction enzyme, S subunit
MKATNGQWKHARLGDHVDVQTGFPFKSKEYVDDPSGVRLLRGDNIVQGNLRWEGVKRWPRSGTSNFGKYSLQVDDVVLAMDRPWIEAGLKYAWITERDLPCLLVQRVSRLRGTNGLLTPYIRYVIGHHSFTDYVKGIWTGIAVPHISETQIRAFQFCLPPVSTQERILGVLTVYDDLIENNTRRIKILKDMAQLIYREWFVNFRFPGNDKVKMVQSTLGPVPATWNLRNLFDVGHVTYGFPFKSNLFTAGGDGIPVIRIRDIMSDFSNTVTTEPADSKYIVKNGDLLVGMDGDFHMGKWAGGNAYLNQRVVRFRPKNDLSPYFLFLALKAPIEHFDSTIVGTTVAHLSDRDLRSINVLTPDDDLLKRVSALFDPLFGLEIALKVKNANLRTTRDLLLPKLISGEIPVDAADDAAAELMENVGQLA